MNNVVTEEVMDNLVEVPFEDTPVVTTETTEELVETPAVVDEAPVVTNDDTMPSWKDCVEAGVKGGVVIGTTVATAFGITWLAEKAGNFIGVLILNGKKKKAAKEAEKAKQQEELERLAQMTPEEVKAEMDAKAAEAQK